MEENTPVYYGSDWFRKNAINWEKHLAEYKDKAFKYLEIGSFEGRSVRWVMENFPKAKAWCVDPFIIPDYFMRDGLPDGYSSYEQFKHNLKPFEDRVDVYKGFSWDWFQKNGKKFLGKFDVIYVDGDHRAIPCLEDAVHAFRCLKVGGLLFFDDYIWKKQLTRSNPTQTPKLAINAFLEIYGDNVELIHQSRQVFVRKIKDLD